MTVRRFRRRSAALVAAVCALAVLTGCVSGNWLIDGDPWQPPDVQVDETVAGYDKFTEQEPEWRDCGDGFECTRVGAPLDWDRPDSETIELAVVRHPAVGEKLGTLFVNPGGPGSGGADFVRNNLSGAVSRELIQHFDVVGWDPRGVGQSSAVHCYTDEELDEELFGDPREYADLEVGSPAWIEEARRESLAFGEACLAGTGDLLGHVDTRSTVRDLDLLRELAGEATLSYLGYSYGTFIGTMYADMFPERSGKLVLDGAIAPDVTMHEVVLMQQRGFEQSLRSYLASCLAGSDCPFTGTVDRAMHTIADLLDSIDRDPLQGPDDRWVDVNTVITATVMALYSEQSWPMLDTLVTELADRETRMAQYLADFYYGREDGTYIDNSTVAFSAINCLDYPRGATVSEMRAQAQEIAEAAPVLGKYAGYGDLGCSEWPFPGFDDRGPMHAEGADPILVIGTTGDPATPYAWAERLAEQLHSGVLITYNGEGHTAYNGGSRCVTQAVDDFFVRGTVPSADPNCS